MSAVLLILAMLILGFAIRWADKTLHNKRKLKQSQTKKPPYGRMFSVDFIYGNTLYIYKVLAYTILDRLSKEEIKHHWGESREAILSKINLEFTSKEHSPDQVRKLTSWQIYNDAVEFGRVVIVESFSHLCEIEPCLASAFINTGCLVTERVHADGDEEIEMLSAASLDRRFRLLKKWRERLENEQRN